MSQQRHIGRFAVLVILIQMLHARNDPLRSGEICRRPSIRKGRVEPDFSRYHYYEAVVIHCSYPYVRIGPGSAYCLRNGNFTELPRCVACNLKPPTNGFVRPRVARVFEDVEFGCKRGFTLDGDGSQYCKRDGTLSRGAPICKRDPFCSKPSLEPNLNVIPDKKKYQVGDEILFQCPPHQNLEPNNAISAVCGKDEMFDGEIPTCVNATEPIACARPSALSSRVIMRPQEDSYAVGSTVRFSCEHNDHDLTGDRSSICRGDGTFSFKRLPTCKG